MLQQNPGQFGHFQLSLGDFLEYSGQFFSSKTALIVIRKFHKVAQISRTLKIFGQHRRFPFCKFYEMPHKNEYIHIYTTENRN